MVEVTFTAAVTVLALGVVTVTLVWSRVTGAPLTAPRSALAHVWRTFCFWRAARHRDEWWRVYLELARRAGIDPVTSTPELDRLGAAEDRWLARAGVAQRSVFPRSGVGPCPTKVEPAEVKPPGESTGLHFRRPDWPPWGGIR